MLGAVRRGSASCARIWLRSSPIQINASETFLLSQCFQRSSQPLSSLPRQFHSVSLLRQYAAPQEAEVEALEEDIKRNANTPPPPAGAPVTRFTELEERGLVCKTVVRTLTSGMRLETMTEVQSKTINETLKGIDV